MPRFIVASLALSPFVGAACTSFSVDAPAANEMDAGSDAPSRSDADDADALTRPSDAGPLRRLFVIGGAIDQGSTEKTYVGSIDPGGAITWRGGPSLGAALANGCAAAVGDRIHFVGGTENSGAIPPGALMRPDDVAPKWTDDVAPAESRILQGCAVDHDRLYVTGGSKAAAGPRVTTEVAAAGVDGRFQWSAGTNLLEGLIKGATAERLLPETRTSHMATIDGWSSLRSRRKCGRESESNAQRNLRCRASGPIAWGLA